MKKLGIPAVTFELIMDSLERPLAELYVEVYAQEQFNGLSVFQPPALPEPFIVYADEEELIALEAERQSWLAEEEASRWAHQFAIPFYGPAELGWR